MDLNQPKCDVDVLLDIILMGEIRNIFHTISGILVYTQI